MWHPKTATTKLHITQRACLFYSLVYTSARQSVQQYTHTKKEEIVIKNIRYAYCENCAAGNYFNKYFPFKLTFFLCVWLNWCFLCCIAVLLLLSLFFFIRHAMLILRIFNSILWWGPLITKLFSCCFREWCRHFCPSCLLLFSIASVGSVSICASPKD